jgi:hypothetical protein
MDEWRWRWRETYSDKFLQLFVTKIVDVSSAIFAHDSGHHQCTETCEKKLGK